MLYTRKVSSEPENEASNTSTLPEEEEEDIGPQFMSLRHLSKVTLLSSFAKKAMSFSNRRITMSLTKKTCLSNEQ